MRRKMLLALLTLVSTARAEPVPGPRWVNVSGRAFARLELDDRVLYGPAYGGGFDALVHIWRPLWVGGYAEWSKPGAFAETGSCADADCVRSQRMLGIVVGIVLPVKAPGRFRIELGAGQRHHVVDQGGFRIVSNGVDVLRLSTGYDHTVADPIYIGGLVDWSMGCFTSMRREDADGRRLDLGKTCFEAPFWVSTGVGVRVGFAL